MRMMILLLPLLPLLPLLLLLLLLLLLRLLRLLIRSSPIVGETQPRLTHLCELLLAVCW